MDPLTESEKTFFEAFEAVARRPYLGYLAGAVLFFIGSALYSNGVDSDRPGRILLGGIFLGSAFFEIVESYLAFRLHGILGKMKARGD